MNVLECFSGTGSVKKCCDELGWNVISVDIDPESKPTHLCSILDFDYKQYPKNYFSVCWFSPPCCAYSNLQNSWLGRKRHGEIYTREKMNAEMEEADKLVLKSLEIRDYFDCEVWFMENPQTGRLKTRDIMRDIPFYDVDYCKYCDWGYKKRTRIWTNKPDWENRLCHNDCDSIITIDRNGEILEDGTFVKANKRSKHICNLGKKQTLKHIHINNLGNSKCSQQINLALAGKDSTKKVKKFHTTLKDRYRVPPDLIYSLLMD